jgi:phosphonoacetate hydrolase
MGILAPNQRVVIGMIDGFGPDYLEKSDMPHLRSMMGEGFGKLVSGIFPSITNVNNVSICCGAFPSEHGITGNSYFDEEAGEARYMNAAELIRAETLFRRAARRGVKSAILTSKRKTVELFGADCEVAIAAERPPEELVARFGPPGDIYSAEINAWLWRVAIDLLERRGDLGVIYVHTTDYPMHAWAADAPESLDHLHRLDALLGEARATAPDAAFFLTADHGMNYKTRNWDLAKACAEAGTSIRFALSPERDYYVKHHRNFTGCAYVWLDAARDYARVERTIRSLAGVEEVVPAEEGARVFHLVRERLGDMIVLGDRDTMFGENDRALEELPPTYRAHGSLHEMKVPLVIFNQGGELPGPGEFQYNKDLTRFLYANGA